MTSLTNLANFFGERNGGDDESESDSNHDDDDDDDDDDDARSGPPPKSPAELMDVIRSDYVDNNYLWTGEM